MWDPASYLEHADQRSRAFEDLLAQVRAAYPRLVVDLGCGPATATAKLLRRWPAARVLGVDSSVAMLAGAAEAAQAGVELVRADLRTWRADAPVDVLLSNATLQWVPGHLELLPELADQVAAGGWFAMQVPGNFAEPSHVLLRELATAPHWRDRLAGLVWPASHDPASYLEPFATAGWSVDVWETTYLHVLPGDDAVLGWVRGSALRPVLAELSAVEAAQFEAAYGGRLREAYRRREYGTLLPYRRVFLVARRPS